MSDFDTAMAAAGAAVKTTKEKKTVTTPTDIPSLPPLSLVSKLAMLANQIGDKAPELHSRDVKFPYHAARDVFGWWRERLQAEHIVIFPEVIESRAQHVEMPRSGGGTRKTFLTELVVKFTFVDGHTGETFQATVYAQGEDPSDKGAGKAMTYAQKELLLAIGMNGSETDNEAYSDDDRDRGERRDQRDRPDVRITDSNIEGIQRGGRANKATDVQIAAIKAKAQSLGVGVRGVAEFVDTVLGIDFGLSSDPQEAAGDLARGLGLLSSEDIGAVLAYMDRSKELETDDNRPDGALPEDERGYEGFDPGYGG